MDLVMTMQSPTALRSRVIGFPGSAARVRRACGSMAEGRIVALGSGAKGLRGVVVQVGAVIGSTGRGPSALEHNELERRLLEMGFVEGAVVEILHEGMIGRDPIGVRLDDMRVALRRREADAVLVRVERTLDVEGWAPFLEAAE